MQIGVKQRLLIFIFLGLFATVTVLGACRYILEKRAIHEGAGLRGDELCKIASELAAPLLMTSDVSGLQNLAGNLINLSDLQEVTISDSAGREVARAAKPALEQERVVAAAFPILSNQAKLGEIRVSVYPAGLEAALRSALVNTVIEHFFIFLILAVILSVAVSKTVTGPLRELEATLGDILERREFARRLPTRTQDEIGALAKGVNLLIERLERFVSGMGAIAGRINQVGPCITEETDGLRQNTRSHANTMAGVSSSAGKITSSLRSAAESAESLSVSAEKTSSAILQMNASNMEVSRQTEELTSSVEDVTTSVTEMIASIREVAGYVDTLSSAAEETSSSAIEIEATVREVEQAAKESAKLSQQVSIDAREIGVGSIEKITGAVQRIRDSVARYSGVMAGLGKRSEEIGKILGVIVEVTERTNLLALNASILAAQAGEHGRGFAVVAEEIKALADRTAGSAQDIAKLIASVQKETREAVEAMNESMVAVEDGVSRSQEAAGAIGKIVASSDRSAETANRIERAMIEQSRGVKQVSESIVNVKQMMNQIAQATQAQIKGTEMILNAGEAMRDIARGVSKAISEQGVGGKQIAEAAENVTARAGTIAAATGEQRAVSVEMVESVQRLQELPRQNEKRAEVMAAAAKTLAEQVALLNSEIAGITGGNGSAFNG